MNEGLNEFLQKMGNDSDNKARILDKILSSADAARVFSEPVTAGEYTVVTASEVAAGGGFGSGMGFGLPPDRSDKAQDEQGSAAELLGGGGGGGGGGGSFARPVAAIVIGPQGVEVRPILDATKVGLAALTTFGAVAALTAKVLKKL